MSEHNHTYDLELIPFDNKRLLNLCGKFNENIHQIESRLKVEILSRGNNFQIRGDSALCAQAKYVLEYLYDLTGATEEITAEEVHLSIINSTKKSSHTDGTNTHTAADTTNTNGTSAHIKNKNSTNGHGEDMRKSNSNGTSAHGTNTKNTAISNTTMKNSNMHSSGTYNAGNAGGHHNAAIHTGAHGASMHNTGAHGAKTKARTHRATPRTPNQDAYVKNINSHAITFGIGPAGTGKTFLAVACAVNALEQNLVSRIVLVRPVVEAGERLGFLPGDLTQKIDPYLRPLYDSLYEMLGFERVYSLLNNQVIEIAPLAYMRGRTLNDAFIILDESQNTTIEQMKMFLTRLGFNSIAVITGDVTQVDLPRGKPSGLQHADRILQNVQDISFSYFNSSDVVRHPAVQQIINAYTADEQMQNNMHVESKPYVDRTPKKPTQIT